MKIVFFYFTFFFSLAAFSNEKVALPFTFLNQYFDYAVQNDNQIMISGRNLDFGYDFVDLKNNLLIFKNNEFLDNNFWNIEIKNKNGKSIEIVKRAKISHQSQIAIKNIEILKDAVSICLSSANKYTQAVLCKAINNINHTNTNNGSYVTHEPTIEVNGLSVQKMGRIVLTQARERVLFRIKYSNFDFVQIVTFKRLFVPSEIEKNSNQEVYDIKFYDLVDRLYSWSDIIAYDQESFVIPNDSILRVQQDFFNKDYSKKDTKITFYRPSIPLKSVNNMYTISPYLTFANLNGNTSNQNLNLQSQMGYGLRGGLNFEFDKKNKYLQYIKNFDFISINTSFEKNSFLPSINSYTINNRDTYFYNLSLGLNKIFNYDFYYGPFVNVSKDFLISKTSDTKNINLESMYNVDTGVQMRYLVFEKGPFQSNLFSGLSMLLPAQYSSETTSLAPRFFLQADVGFRNINTAYLFGFHYDYREQQTSSQKIKEQSFDYMFNYSVYY